MKHGIGTRVVLVGASLIAVLSAACGTIPTPAIPALSGLGSDDEIKLDTSAAPMPTPSTLVSGARTDPSSAYGSRRSAVVKRGNIVETLQLYGRVAGQEELTLTAPVSGRVDAVAVKPGQSVHEGDLLVQADSKQIEKDLAAARARLETSSLRMQQAQAQTDARQRDVARRVAADQARKQVAVSDAQAGLRRAQAELDRIRAGSADADIQAAQDAVTSAQAALDQAQQQQDQQQQKQQQQAQQQQKQQREQAARLAGLQLKSAQRDVQTAQAHYAQAQTNLERLKKGPDAAEVRAAERDVERAQNELQAKSSTQVDDNERAAHDAEIADARLNVQAAQDQLAQVRAGATPQALEAAQLAVDDARRALDAANDQVSSLRTGLAQSDSTDATTTVPDDITSPAVQTARQVLELAQAHLAELTSHPTPTELRDAMDRVAAAQAALNQARSSVDDAQPPDDPALGDFETVVLAKSIEGDRAEVESLEHDLAATRLVAPSAGVVAAVQVRPGDSLVIGRPVLVLTKPGQPIIALDLDPDDAARVSTGQKATVQLDGDAGPPLDGSVLNVGKPDSQGGPVAQLQVAWPKSPPVFGATAQVVLAVQEKDNVLLVPRKALRTAGTKQYVEYMDGGSRKVADVQIGIIGDDDVEVLSGLKDGQTILVGL